MPPVFHPIMGQLTLIQVVALQIIRMLGVMVPLLVQIELIFSAHQQELVIASPLRTIKVVK